jgi:hypothetical protein
MNEFESGLNLKHLNGVKNILLHYVMISLCHDDRDFSVGLTYLSYLGKWASRDIQRCCCINTRHNCMIAEDCSDMSALLLVMFYATGFHRALLGGW